MSISSGDPARYAFLDGLRGWAALVVMLLHVFFGSLGAMDYGFLQMRLWWSLNGNYMVGLFFVVSGFALSVSYLAKGDRGYLWRIAGGRYFRLMIPIFATGILVTLFLKLGLFPSPEARTSAYQGHYPFDPTIGHLLRFSFFDVFFTYDSVATYAGPLWTMSYELIGSFALLFLLLVMPGRWSRVVMGLAVAGAFFANESYYSLFFIGGLSAELYVILDERRLRAHRSTILCSTALLIVGYAITRFAPDSPFVLLVSVTLWFLGSMLNPAMRGFLESRLSRFLGFISFPLYLVHEAMIVAVGIPIYVGAETVGMRLLAGLLATIASILLALAFTPVNTVALIVSRSIGNAVASMAERIGTRLKTLIRMPRPVSKPRANHNAG